MFGILRIGLTKDPNSGKVLRVFTMNVEAIEIAEDDDP